MTCHKSGTSAGLSLDGCGGCRYGRLVGEGLGRGWDEEGEEHGERVAIEIRCPY